MRWFRRRSDVKGNPENLSKFVLVLVLFYLSLFFRVRTIIEYCFIVALIPIRMYINLVLYYYREHSSSTVFASMYNNVELYDKHANYVDSFLVPS